MTSIQPVGIPMALSTTKNRRPALPSDFRRQAGDRLTRQEFERRWQLSPQLKKAELIDGRVYLHSAVNVAHGESHAWIVGWLMRYVVATPGVAGSSGPSVRLDQDNEPQPDVCLRVTADGQSSIDSEGFLCGPPELIVEIASSSVSYDLHDKLNVYRRSGVAEYLVWRVLDRDFDWFVLRDGQYQPLAPQDGILKGEVFPGLWLDKPALLAGDLAKVMAVLGQGLADPSHAAFAERLKSNGDKS